MLLILYPSPLRTHPTRFTRDAVRAGALPSPPATLLHNSYLDVRFAFAWRGSMATHTRCATRYLRARLPRNATVVTNLALPPSLIVAATYAYARHAFTSLTYQRDDDTTMPYSSPLYLEHDYRHLPNSAMTTPSYDYMTTLWDLA